MGIPSPELPNSKRELLKVPFFGWGLAAIRPIAIDRAAGRAASRVAVEQLTSQGRERLRLGRCVMIFPESTRVPPGETQRYRMGGAVLATGTEAPVVPVAHNAGEITIAIGPPIDTTGKTADQINTEARQWIESRMAEMA